ncbi:MAG: glutamine synthetase III [Chitinispirillales bacterium]|jgi:glutamine synthetase|nr:glutamine synthetase III [Chitinispirillales bacterium]
MSTRSTIAHSIAPAARAKVDIPPPVSSYYGVNTFSEPTMRKMVSEETFKAFKRWQKGEAVISGAQTDEIAAAMKEWAVSRGASAYSHWFQPMTGLIAEKFEGFIALEGESCGVIEKFTGSKLILGEPDASSFSSGGGARAAFEARGYMAWDPSSPAFITEVALGKTLCIPSIFISYNGDALDQKLPLLRSEAAINEAASGLLKLFGRKARYVYSTCGVEQEFFLVDKGWYNERADLMLTGRTLVGAPPSKDQQLEDQYFGCIKERVLNYMHEVCSEAFKLGIPVTTRHNEVAPNQYEFAPIFEKSNLAADHNLLLMDIMKEVALRHNLVCLLHEKPFSGVNGSGKHVNWSLSDDGGNNLLVTGDTHEDNVVFLTVAASVVHAMHRHGDLLRATAASAGNERRLGANEAPPAIMSVYLGEQLTKILSAVEAGGKADKGKKRDAAAAAEIDIGPLPKFMHDTTDSSRTSPFAFTGAKFEFRTLGSSMNVSTVVTVINTIVADSMRLISERIKKELSGGAAVAAAALKVLAGVVKESKPILFDGNNYSGDWAKEAKARNLPNAVSTLEALKAFLDPKAVSVFERHKVLSESELAARYAIWLDKYEKTLAIEIRTLKEIVNTQVLPSAYSYQADIAGGLEVLKVLADDMTIDMVEGALEDRKEMFEKLTADIFYIRKSLKELDARIEKAQPMEQEERVAYLFSDILPQISHIRKHVDALEGSMPDEMWPLPKYKEMLFIL